MPARSREEVLNVILALVLNKRGIVAAPEKILKTALEKKRVMPDVLVDYYGLRMAIEGKVGSSPAIKKAASEAARARVESGLAHIAIAVVYPPELPALSQLNELEEAITHSILNIAIFTESQESKQLTLPIQGLGLEDSPQKPVWIESDVDNLGSVLRRAYENLTAENVVVDAADAIKSGLESFSPLLLKNQGAIQRAGKALGIRTKTED